MPNSSCDRISIVFEDHSYNICMSNRRIYIVKLRNGSSALKSVNSGSGGNLATGNGISNNAVFAESEGILSSAAALT